MSKIWVVDGTHLSGPYEGTLLGTIPPSADSHLFNVTDGIVLTENNGD